MMLSLIFLQLSFEFVFASVVFEDCGSAYDLQAVNIEGCGPRLPCIVTLGETVPVILNFRAGFQSRRLDQNVVISINHVNLRTDVTPELCDSVMCPVNTVGLTALNSKMTVPVDIALEIIGMPSLIRRTIDGDPAEYFLRRIENQRGYLRWRIFNESGVMVLCYSVLVQTQSLRQKQLNSSNTDTSAM